MPFESAGTSATGLQQVSVAESDAQPAAVESPAMIACRACVGRGQAGSNWNCCKFAVNDLIMIMMILIRIPNFQS
jgi:hypothetical protein